MKVRWQKLDSGLRVGQFVLQAGEEVCASLQSFHQEEDQDSTYWVQAIGASDRVLLGHYRQKSQRYHSREIVGDLEIVQLSGNLSLKKDGSSFAHLHAVVSDEAMSCYGGHLHLAQVSVTLEGFLWERKGRTQRELDPAFSLELWRW